MSDIKSVIGLLCKHLKLLFDVNLKPEHFRLSKFDKVDGNCGPVCHLWDTLFKICSIICSLSSYEGDVVVFVKLNFAMMGYKNIEFYCLPPDMSSGSRELLLALAWLLVTKNVLEKCTSRKLRYTPLNIEFDVVVNEKREGHTSQKVYNDRTFENSLNSLLWIAGKIRHNIKAIAEEDQERISFASKVHESTINTCGLPHLSVKETKLVRYPQLLPKYFSEVEEKILLMDTHKQWLKKCHIFWEWMETVVMEKESEEDLNHLNDNENRVLFSVLDILRLRVKHFLIQNENAKNCGNVCVKTDASFQSIQGMPRCMIETKDTDTEMEHLLLDSELQLQEVKKSYINKSAAIRLYLHKLSKQMQDVDVLFPPALK